MSLKRDLRDLLARYEARGWAFNTTRAGHVCGKGPDGQLVFGPSTPSDYRGLRNFRAQLRREHAGRPGKVG